MRTTTLDIPGLRLIAPDVNREAQGEFTFFYDERDFVSNDLPTGFVQEHGSFYPIPWTVRGLHSQRAPDQQIKLVRVARGRIFDVVVDVRQGSPTFGRHVNVELSAANRAMLLVPVGLAHGFCTLEPDTEVVFRLTRYNERASQTGLRWNDPALGIDWPCGENPGYVFAFDRDLPPLREYPPVFTFDATSL